MDVEEEQDMSEASKRRNKIANDMWRQYQEVLQQRRQAGLGNDSEELESDDRNEGSDEESDNDFYV